MPMIIRLKLLLLGLLFSTPAHSFSPVLNTLIFQIALDELPAQKKSYVLDEVNFLSSAGCNLRDAATAGWLDYQKVPQWLLKHFHSLIVHNPQKIDESRYRPARNNLGRALKALRLGIKNRNFGEQGAFTRSLTLRFLTHLYGDAHQPLHTIVPLYKIYVSKRNPSGNSIGGERIRIKLSKKIVKPPYSRNLHALWDTGGWTFQFPNGSTVNEKDFEQCSPTKRELLLQAVALEKSGLSRQISKEWRELYKSSTIKDLTVDELLEESSQLAKTVALQPLEDQIFKLKHRNSTVLITPSYFDNMKETSKKQVVVAGVRLGRFLNKALTVPKGYSPPREEGQGLFQEFFRWLKNLSN